MLKLYLEKFATAYIDNILIYSKTKYKQYIYQVLKALQENNLLINPEKCKFHTQEVEFLGYIITPKEVKIDSKKVAAIQKWEPLNSVKEV